MSTCIVSCSICSDIMSVPAERDPGDGRLIPRDDIEFVCDNCKDEIDARITAAQPSLQPGVHPHISFEDYLALPYVSASFLKRFRQSPASALIPIKPTKQMLFGAACHCYVLEGPDVFLSRYSVMPAPPEKDGKPISKNSNQWKDLKAEWERQNPGKAILPYEYSGGSESEDSEFKLRTIDVLTGVRDSLHSHPIIKNVLAECRTELTLIWDDEETGLRCKARVDIDPSKQTVAELKFTGSFDRFYYIAQEKSYDIALGHYFNAASACGLNPTVGMLMWAEFQRPHRCDQQFFGDGELEDWFTWSCAEARRLLHLVKECKERDFWPTWQIPSDCHSISQLNPIDCRARWGTPVRRIS